MLVATIASDREDRLISKRIASDGTRMGFSRAFDLHFDAWFAPGAPASVRGWIRRQMRSTPDELGLELVGAYSPLRPHRGRLGEIRRPTLVIGTRSDDSAPPGQSRRLAELIPGRPAGPDRGLRAFPHAGEAGRVEPVPAALPGNPGRRPQGLTMSSGPCRVEHDFLGGVQVPREALYGAQTQRALDNFPLSGERSIGDYPALAEALLAHQVGGCRGQPDGGGTWTQRSPEP